MVIVDSYPESNYGIYSYFTAGFLTASGQSFTGNGGRLNKTTFYLNRGATGTGTLVSKVYAHAGTFGGASTPTGTALATSGSINIAGLNSSFTLVDFTFTGAEKIMLTNETKFVVTLESTEASSNAVAYAFDGTDNSHPGNLCYKYGTWAPGADDLIFYVYSDDIIGPFPTYLR